MVYRAIGVGGGVVLWYLIAFTFPENLLPYPQQVISAAVDLFRTDRVLFHVGATLRRTVLAFGGSFLIGGAVGVLMGTSSIGRRFLIPHVLIWFSVPAVAAAAMTTLMFGYGELAILASTVVITFPYIAVNVWKGVESIDSELVEMSSSYGVSTKRTLLRVIVRDTAPSLFSASRFGLAISWKIVTVAEMFAADNGVGQKIIGTYELFRFEQTWAWAFIFMFIILLLEYCLFKPLERRVFDYRQDADFTQLGGGR
ncbi:ABC transporter permease [Halorientalis marina]|uniref:ABC transporter permease n=1 Tax=Halorientalis marina TaxID=2931976 RepID=UPI001FF38D7A|nr:ABC transporter permease [Halorientalis marina]